MKRILCLLALLCLVVSYIYAEEYVIEEVNTPSYYSSEGKEFALWMSAGMNLTSKDALMDFIKRTIPAGKTVMMTVRIEIPYIVNEIIFPLPDDEVKVLE